MTTAASTEVTEGDMAPRFPRLRKLLYQRRGFSDTEKTAAALLLVATIVALIWANLPNSSYDEFWRSTISLQVGQTGIQLDFRSLVNEALMTLFFFVVGLEVKREFALGELSEWSRAVVPVAAAIAGLAVPALIFLIFNHTDQTSHAWGVVISSDTAFLLGALAIVGPRLPGHLRIFLLALAVVDDVGALAVIAIFYTDEVHVTPLIVAAVGLVVIWMLRYLRFGQGPAYLVFSLVVWGALYASGVQPTLAGVAIALVIPVYSPRRMEVERAAELSRAFRQSPNPAYAQAAVRGLLSSVSVNDRLHTLYSPYTSFIILPIFALANAGVHLDAATLTAAFGSPLTWGIIVGLVVGKFVGITGMTVLVKTLKIGVLAPGLTFGRVAGGAALSGIGFTIALFIIDLAIPDPALQDEARVGVLAATVIAFVLGWAVFRVVDKVQPPSKMSLVLARPVDAKRDHFRGPIDAPMQLVEYGDFECPFCSRATGSIDEVRAHFGSDLLYVWRHLPLTKVHPHATLAARASEAAALQGKFFIYGPTMFAHQDALELDDLLAYAVSLGMDVDRFEEDMRSSEVVNRVRDDVIDAELMDVHSTPTFFVNGKRHRGPYDAASLIRELNASRTDRAGGPADPAQPADSAVAATAASGSSAGTTAGRPSGAGFASHPAAGPIAGSTARTAPIGGSDGPSTPDGRAGAADALRGWAPAHGTEGTDAAAPGAALPSAPAGPPEEGSRRDLGLTDKN
ncbi:Na+/H+ antiporter NhaA [Subtercola endophyticus]|uniref:Na+/H+ antiporter NhaA n=1 Tax=Subtercola endophyticus TaxID=2895559 RepID=UPI001E590D3C|nr:Na+/H+ antiporter NhaA [Subtercola endophyticus]UFS59265.1 Na+/H+ antiporter NhaA [Subtercola endophyticus]